MVDPSRGLGVSNCSILRVTHEEPAAGNALEDDYKDDSQVYEILDFSQQLLLVTTKLSQLRHEPSYDFSHSHQVVKSDYLKEVEPIVCWVVDGDQCRVGADQVEIKDDARDIVEDNLRECFDPSKVSSESSGEGQDHVEDEHYVNYKFDVEEVRKVSICIVELKSDISCDVVREGHELGQTSSQEDDLP